MYLWLSIFSTAVCLSAPSAPEGYLIKQGGLVDIPDGAYVQGSSTFGGIQPDYRIDLNDPDLKLFLEQVRGAVAKSFMIRSLEKVGLRRLANHKKIELVTALVQKALPQGAYDAEPYLRILEEHRLQNVDITLGSYLRCQAGVCRENALLTHQALKAVGVENRFVYVFANQYGGAPEDHAIVVVEEKGVRWIVDPYNPNFHGRSLEDLMEPAGSNTRTPRLASFATSKGDVARILRINSYPTYWIPEANGRLKCSSAFH